MAMVGQECNLIISVCTGVLIWCVGTFCSSIREIKASVHKIKVSKSVNLRFSPCILPEVSDSNHSVFRSASTSHLDFQVLLNQSFSQISQAQ
jgi:hypothetical protein